MSALASALASARVQPLDIGARGFDINRPVTAALARAFKLKGFEFVFRYIWRDYYRPGDLTAQEIDVILSAGLGLGIVQHAPLPGWAPTRDIGAAQATAALAALQAFGIPKTVTVAWDLEGVADGTSADAVDACGRAWSFVLSGMGYSSRCLYVGDSHVLGPNGLYNLPFNLYWRAYNTNEDQTPTRRGWCMKQIPARDEDIPAGFSLATTSIDVNVVYGDALGGFPAVLMPGPETLADGRTV